MTEISASADDLEQPAGKSGKAGLVIGLVLALAGGGGGFYAVQSGLLFGGGKPADAHAGESGSGHSDGHGSPALAASAGMAFVEVDPILISLSESAMVRHLRFRAQLEVAAPYQSDIQHLMPRIVDLLNGYLRALSMRDFEDPLILTRLRAQLLRRIQIVAGPDRVNDVLIMEFVLN